MKNRVILTFLSFGLLIPAVWAVPVSVQVVDEAGQPIPDAEIYLNVENLKAQTARTDATGQHNFEAPVEEGQWIGRALARKSGLAVGGANLKKGENKIVLPRATQISGVVTDTNGTPIQGAKVEVQTVRTQVSKQAQVGGFGNWLSLFASPFQLQYMAQTDANGAFRIEGVPPDAEANLNVVAPRFAAQNAKIKSGESEKIALAMGTSIRGQVLDLTGKPLEGVEVTARDADETNYNNRQSAKTDAQGRYEILGLVPATFNLFFGADDAAPYAFPAQMGVAARAGEVAEAPASRAENGIVFRGKVVAADDRKPLKNVTVGINADWIQKYPRTDEKGEFSVRTLPGKHQVHLASFVKGFKSNHRQREISVGADSEPLVLELERARILRGQIVDENGAPIEVTVYGHANYDSFPIKSGADGKFEADVTLDGKIKLQGMGAHDFRNAPDWEVVSPREVSPDANREIKIVVRRAEKHELRGQAQDENGAPIAGARVRISLSRENSSTWHDAQTDGNGQFSVQFSSDIKASFTHASKDGYDWKSGGEIEGAAPKFVAKPVIFAVRDGQIAGRVTLETGRNASGARVLVGEDETRADAEGKYEIKGLPRGPKRVVAALDNALGTAPDGGELVLKPFVLPTKNSELARQILAEKPARNDIERWWLFSETELREKMTQIIEKGDIWEQLRAASLMKTRVSPAEYITLLESVKSPAVRFYLLVDFLETQRDLAPFAAQIEAAKALLPEAKNQSDWNWSIAARWIALAAILEKAQGTEAGSQTLLEASQWIFRTFPATSRNSGDRSSVLGMSAGFLALSPALSEQLMSLLQIDDPGYSRALSEMAQAHARAGNLERAAALLEQLRTAPAPQETENASGDNSWLHAQAALRCVEMGAAKNPKVALEIARGIQNRGSQRAEALVLVALELPMSEARPLFREAFGLLPEHDGARFLRRLRAKEESLARETLEEIRAKVTAREVAAQGEYSRPKIAQFAFYEADFDAPSAYLRLEREWAKATQQRWAHERFACVLAMTKLDPQRALEWARILDAESANLERGQRLNLFSEIARYVNSDDAARQRVKIPQWQGGFSWASEENGWF